MSYNYLLVKLNYINSAHAEDRDMESDDETEMVSHIQEIYFSTPNISTIFRKINDVPFEDNIEFNVTEEQIIKRFEQRSKFCKDKIYPITEEIGTYFKNHVAQYFICIIQLPVMN